MKTNPGEHSEQDRKVEERKEFYTALFRFNALLDVKIDEEEFQWVPGEGGNGKKTQKNNENLIIEILGIALSKKALEEYRKPAVDVIQKIPYCLGTKSDRRPLDVKLHEIWKDFIKEKENKFHRLRGLCLLLITKYTRALLQNDPLRENLSNEQDALTRFASANISYVYDPENTEESVYLQSLILLECAACASHEATIGFLNLADSTARDKIKDSNKKRDSFKEEFDAVVPFFDALIAYNKAIAFYHSNRREEALKSVQKVIPQMQQKNPKIYKSSLDENELLLYLVLPALHQKADLLNKMQCCTNAIEVLVKLANTPVKGARYKRIRTLLLKALCWLDMGDRQRAFKSIEKCLNPAGEGSEKYLHEELIRGLERCKEPIWEPGAEINEDQYRNWLRIRPTLSTDAAKLILQCDLERWKDSPCDDNDPLYENRIQQSKTCIGNLSNFIKIHQNDCFQRQNLKEIAVDWLKEVSLIKRVKTGKNNTPKHEIVANEKWRKAITNVLKCLGNQKRWDKAPYDEDGDIANEIWGDNFKKFDSKKLLDILTELTDFCEGFFHDEGAHKHKKGQKCQHQGERGFLRALVEFELKVLGLQGGFDFPKEDKESVYPKQGTYEYRSAIRRGSVLRKYYEIAEDSTDKKCESKKTCFYLVKENLTWLGKNGEGGFEACLKKLKDTWEHERENKEDLKIVKQPTLWLEDYSRIIGDSDFRKHLQAGRSKQPINIFINRNKDKLTGVEFVALRRWNSHTPEISFSKGGGYFVFIPEDFKIGDRINDKEGGVCRATKLGIVVDPGFDYIHNFFSQGFTLDDIDLVLITHADADHINDYAGLADLFRVRSDTKKIFTFLPRNAHKILIRHITDESYRPLYYDTVLVDVNGDISRSEFSLKLPVGNGSSPPRMIIENDEAGCEGPFLKIECVPASHDDHAGERPGSFGYVLTFSERHKETKKIDVFGTIGFTGDSQWFPEYAEAFGKCDMVCSHMGSVLGDKVDDYEKDPQLGDWEAMIRKKNHPYLPGEVLFLEQLRKLEKSPEERIVVLSEFGEELKGLIRKDVCERLNRCMSLDSNGCWSNFIIQEKATGNTEPEEGKEEVKKEDYCVSCDTMHKKHQGDHKDKKEHNDKHIRTIPADIGLRISVRDGEKPMVHCVLCDRFHDPEDMEWIPHGSEEALFYVCGPCYRSKSRDIRVARYQSILDSGRPVLRAHKQEQ